MRHNYSDEVGVSVPISREIRTLVKMSLSTFAPSWPWVKWCTMVLPHRSDSTLINLLSSSIHSHVLRNRKIYYPVQTARYLYLSGSRYIPSAPSVACTAQTAIWLAVWSLNVRTQPHTAQSGARDVALIALGTNGPFTVLSGSMKQRFGRQRFYNNKEMEMAVRELLLVQ